MSVSLTILIIAALFIAGGVYMMLERTLSRIILGFVMLGNGINLLFLTAIGLPGKPPFEGYGAVSEMSDPLPMALVLTAIVIALALTGFGMALSYRAWQLFGHDEVPDDVEDRRIVSYSRRRAYKAQTMYAQLVGAEAESEALITMEDLDLISSDINSDEIVDHEHSEPDVDYENLAQSEPNQQLNVAAQQEDKA